MTASSLLREIQEILKNRSDSLDILSFIMGVDYKDVPLLLSSDVERNARVEEIIQKLKDHIPPSYITNRRYFYGREFYVNNNVLIPRFETEILVEKAIALAPVKKPRIFDLCTGSGCVLLSVLAEIEGATGVGIDINDAALDVANENRRRLGLESRAEFIKGDVLNGFNVSGKFDMVLSNPPYVTKQEYETLEKSVLYEPVLALVAGDNGLEFYKKLIDIVPDLCNKNWVALAEIGAEQSNALSRIYGGFEHRFFQDLNGINRVLFWKSLS